jgi:protoporphyrinogen oxidase
LKKVTIIGAGISGLSAARFLSSKTDVTVIEKSDKVGGLVKCDIVSGNLFHKVGGHVFNAKNKEIFNWFWSHFDRDKEFIKAKRNARILYKNKFIGYPLENHLWEFKKEIIINVISELLYIHQQGKKEHWEFDNFEEFLRGNFGNTLYNLYFKPYNQKIWNTDLSKVALEWLEGKLPMPDINEILINNITKGEETEMAHSSFYYPITGGSQFIACRLSEGLKIIKNTPVQNIQIAKNNSKINGEFIAEGIVYTGDVRKLASIIEHSDHELQIKLNAVRELKSNGTSNLFCECDDNNISWLYIPEEFTKAHRIIYTGNFSPSNNAGSNKKTCVVEFSGKVDPETMKSEIRKLPGNLSPITYNYEPNSYVIQEKDTRQKINDLKKHLHKYNFYLVGRFAEWEYYNMDKAIEASRNLSLELFPA